MSLLESLILVSEKAANVARICRQNTHLFELLVQEKKSDEANPRFIQDFKTLADVLIQEIVKHDIGSKFPEIKPRIYGEENNTFCNTLGENITVEILSSQSVTSNLLGKVLNGDTEAADLLSMEVHKNILLSDITTKDIPDDNLEIDFTNIGIWIDPIDSTAEYINAEEKQGDNNILVSGLRCVTVLIGVYDIQTGNPLLGVMNQPFYCRVNDTWRGHCYWGFSIHSKVCCSVDTSQHQTKNLVCISSSENAALKTKLEENGFNVLEMAGAGYKILATITGSADAYILSKDSTFKWDTCGPQAILKSLGGDIVNFQFAMLKQFKPIEYTDKTQSSNTNNSFCNHGGIIAYRDIDILNAIVDIINDK